MKMFEDNEEILFDKETYLVSPVGHRMSFHTFIANKDLYYQLIKKYINCTDPPHYEDGKKNGYEFFIGDDKYIFKSKKGISNRKNGKGKLIQNFEYTFKKHYNKDDRNDRERTYFLMKPYTKDFYYKDGKPLKLPNGEGVGVFVDSTYKEMAEDEEILRKILEYFELSDYLKYEKKECGVLTNCEYYYRIDEEFEQRIANVMKKIDELISLSTDEFTQVFRNRRGKKWLMFTLRSNRFDELGFYNNETKWRFGLKLYRMKNDSTLDENDPCRHPKLEVYLDPKGKDELIDLEYPRLDDYSKVKETMYQIIGNIIVWASVTNKDMVQDLKFDPNGKDKFIVQEKKHAFQKLKNFYDRLSPEIRVETQLESKRDYLRALVHDETMNYQELIEKTGLGYERIRKMTNGLEKSGILNRIKSSCSFVMFRNRKTFKIVKAILRHLDGENRENIHKKKNRIITRIKRRMRARKVRMEQSEIPIESKLAKILFRFKVLKERDIDSIILSTYKMKEPKPPPEYYKNVFSSGHLSEGFI